MERDPQLEARLRRLEDQVAALTQARSAARTAPVPDAVPPLPESPTAPVGAAGAGGDPAQPHVPAPLDAAPGASDPGAPPAWGTAPADATEMAAPGIVQYAGEVPLPTGGAISWRWGYEAGALLAAPWSPSAQALAALGHPVRLEILRWVLHGVDSVAALVEQLDTGTSGQVYHHVRELAAAGWLATAGRGAYAIPPQRIVPLLAIVLAASTPA